MRWAVDHGADVLNVSIAPAQVDISEGDTETSPLAAAADYADRHGVAVAMAAGNNSSGFNSFELLKGKSTVLVVGALARDGTVATYSNSGASIYAPGGDGYKGADRSRLSRNVLSTHYKGTDAYGTAAGTSVAAPMVAGVFALLMAKGYSASDAKDRILNGARGGAVLQLDAARALGTSGLVTCGARVASTSTARVAAPSVRRAVATPTPPAPAATPEPKVVSMPVPPAGPLGPATPPNHTPSGRNVLISIDVLLTGAAVALRLRPRIG
jgi:subtilisin family serine protease